MPRRLPETMKELGVRLLVLIIAGTALGTLFMFVSGFLVTEESGQGYWLVQAVLFLIFAGVLVGIWEGLNFVR